MRISVFVWIKCQQNHFVSNVSFFSFGMAYKIMYCSHNVVLFREKCRGNSLSAKLTAVLKSYTCAQAHIPWGCS